MDNGYIVRFIRKDDRPVEEFFYHTFEDATSHLLLFRDDDSDLYARIEIIDGATEKAVSIQEFLCKRLVVSQAAYTMRI